jgi:hypothetical protein
MSERVDPHSHRECKCRNEGEGLFASEGWVLSHPESKAQRKRNGTTKYLPAKNVWLPTDFPHHITFIKKKIKHHEGGTEINKIKNKPFPEFSSLVTSTVSASFFSYLFHNLSVRFLVGPLY